MSEDNTSGTGIQGPIGVALSGGGYRAAAYHLGTLAYLHALEEDGLLPGVAMISTVSGGTFTGVAYALALAQDKPFDDYFREFRSYLDSTNLIKDAFSRLAAGETDSGRRRDVITGLADAYSETFLADRQGVPHRFGVLLDTPTALREAVFNATEFRSGRAFRFQRSARPGARIGNARLFIPREEAAKIRLGDIVAASSCFPAGFEPLAFPDDFDWPGGVVPPAVRDAIGEAVPLMDGGIYDNQGIESLLYADDRDAGELGLFIISDVDPDADNLYEMPPDIRTPVIGNLSLGSMNIIAWALMVACAATALVVGADFVRAGARDLVHLVANLLAVGLAAVTSLALWRLRSAGRKIISSLPATSAAAAWRDLRQVSVNQFLTMVNLRVTSLLAMTRSIFMRRIRQLGFGLVYRDARYEKKRVSNLIYSLTREWSLADMPVERPSPALLEVIHTACAMPTTLWFDRPDQLPCLITAGRATLCYNLMKYVRRHHGSDPADYLQQDPAVARLWDRLLADWNAMNADPHGWNDLAPSG